MEIKNAIKEDIDKLIPELLKLRPQRSIKELKEMIARLMVDGVRLIYIGNDEIDFSVAAYQKLNMLFRVRLYMLMISLLLVLIEEKAVLAD